MILEKLANFQSELTFLVKRSPVSMDSSIGQNGQGVHGQGKSQGNSSLIKSHGKVMEFWNGSGNLSNLWKVMEKSWNFIYIYIYIYIYSWLNSIFDEIFSDDYCTIAWSKLYVLQFCLWCWVETPGVHLCREEGGGLNHTSSKLTFSASFKQVWKTLWPYGTIIYLLNFDYSWRSFNRMISCCPSLLKNRWLFWALYGADS